MNVLVGKILQIQRECSYNIGLAFSEKSLLELTEKIIMLCVYRDEFNAESGLLAESVMGRNPRLYFEELCKRMWGDQPFEADGLGVAGITSHILKGTKTAKYQAKAKAKAINNYLKNTVYHHDKELLLKYLKKTRRVAGKKGQDYWLLLSSWVYYWDDNLLVKLCNDFGWMKKSIFSGDRSSVQGENTHFFSEAEMKKNLDAESDDGLYSKTTAAVIASITYQFLKDNQAWVDDFDCFGFLMNKKDMIADLTVKKVPGRGKEKILNFATQVFYGCGDAYDLGNSREECSADVIQIDDNASADSINHSCLQGEGDKDGGDLNHEVIYDQHNESVKSDEKALVEKNGNLQKKEDRKKHSADRCYRIKSSEAGKKSRAINRRSKLNDFMLARMGFKGRKKKNNMRDKEVLELKLEVKALRKTLEEKDQEHKEKLKKEKDKLNRLHKKQLDVIQAAHDQHIDRLNKEWQGVIGPLQSVQAERRGNGDPSTEERSASINSEPVESSSSVNTAEAYEKYGRGQMVFNREREPTSTVGSAFRVHTPQPGYPVPIGYSTPYFQDWQQQILHHQLLQYYFQMGESGVRGYGPAVFPQPQIQRDEH